MANHEVEEFWEELLAQIEAGQVIPVVGPEMLTAMVEGQERPLCRLLAERLLAKYGLSASEDPEGGVVLHPFHELNDAVCALIAKGKQDQNLYRPVCEILTELMENAAGSSLGPLRDLASISAFKLFLTTTPDDLLSRAINAERHGGIEKTDQIIFSPNLASGTQRDLPENPSSGYTAVCYLFGKGSLSPYAFAIHDEDILEFVHHLQINAGESMRRVYSELCTQNLLFIGCKFPDWLSRFFIRLSNTQRLGWKRSKREFMLEEAEGGNLTRFLERFSPNTWMIPGSSREFVAELVRRWRERHPRACGPVEDLQPRRSSEGTIFISYAHEDFSSAHKLLGELDGIGGDVAWFDKSALKPGDTWDHEIEQAISRCSLFLPLISSNTEKRDEGYFRKEWKLASDRADMIQGRKFIIPIVVDLNYDGNAGKYSKVQKSFLEQQYGHAPEGALSQELKAELNRLIHEKNLPRPSCV